MGRKRKWPLLPVFICVVSSKEIVSDTIGDLTTQTMTSAQVKPKMLSGNNTAQGWFLRLLLRNSRKNALR
jgi:hypothetical protein